MSLNLTYGVDGETFQDGLFSLSILAFRCVRAAESPGLA